VIKKSRSHHHNVVKTVVLLFITYFDSTFLKMKFAHSFGLPTWFTSTEHWLLEENGIFSQD